MELNWTGYPLTCICAKTDEGETYEAAGPHEIKIMENFIEWIAEYPLTEYKLITYNGIVFDIPFIIGRLAISKRATETGLILLDYEPFDIFAFIKKLTKKNMSMDAVSKLLGCKSLKTGTGLHAIELAKQGKWEELREYCSADVLATEELYLKLKKIHGDKIE